MAHPQNWTRDRQSLAQFATLALVRNLPFPNKTWFRCCPLSRLGNRAGSGQGRADTREAPSIDSIRTRRSWQRLWDDFCRDKCRAQYFLLACTSGVPAVPVAVRHGLLVLRHPVPTNSPSVGILPWTLRVAEARTCPVCSSSTA